MPPAAIPKWAVLEAPAAWQSVDFISDLHLHEQDAATFDAWQRYLHDTSADAVFILGDLFESWVGDDAAIEAGFEHRCEAVLQLASQQRAILVMHGNRDFLLGTAFANRTGVHMLDEPTLFHFAGRQFLLTHGDLLCVADTAYQALRLEVRSPQWQAHALAQPLAARRALAQRMRAQSAAHQRTGEPLGVVDEPSALSWLDQTGAIWLIHGHTHAPAEHQLPGGRMRVVLSDWDAGSLPRRLEALRVDAQGMRRIALA